MGAKGVGAWWMMVGVLALVGCAEATPQPAASPARDTELPPGAFSGEHDGVPPPEEPAPILRPRLSHTVVLGDRSDAGWTQAGERARVARAPSAPYVDPTNRDLFAEDAARTSRYGRTYRTRTRGFTRGFSSGGSRGGAMFTRTSGTPAVGGNWHSPSGRGFSHGATRGFSSHAGRSSGGHR